MPPEIRIAYDYGLARSFNQPLIVTIPPGTVFFTIAPTTGVWVVYGYQYGNITPGFSPNVNIAWAQEVGIELFVDPMISSVFKHPYHVWAVVTLGSPFQTWLNNYTALTYSVDCFIYIAHFNTTNFRRWYELLVEMGLRKEIPEKIRHIIEMERP